MGGETRVCICADCGGQFLFRRCEQERYRAMGWADPKRCPDCRAAVKARRRRAAEERENAAWQKKKAEEQARFEEKLTAWRTVPVEEVRPKRDRTLYVLGNGFDLMHGVRSSYYAFRDSMGKRNPLRWDLETFLTPEDIWADFEEALGHFDGQALGSGFLVDQWLDDFGAYDKDAAAADFFLAVEAAGGPLRTIAEALPGRFRRWVEGLAPGTADRPLRAMFRGGKVLCFNYTEFVETLYGVPREAVCYLHGCRRRERGRSPEPLILGHRPGASDDAYPMPEWSARKSRRRRELFEAAQDQVLWHLAESDRALTKDSAGVLEAHRDFFRSLGDMETVVTVGHSLSPVDWDYFRAAAEVLPRGAAWYFGCHSLGDLERLEELLPVLGLTPEEVTVFRTDTIRVTMDRPAARTWPTGGWPVERTRCRSADGRWSVRTEDNRLRIVDETDGRTDRELQAAPNPARAFFTPDEAHLVVLLRGVDAGVLLFRREGEHWAFAGELEGIPNQGVVTPRLRRVLWTPETLTFVYQSRVRTYALSDGRLTEDRAVRRAPEASYPGVELGEKFLSR